MKMFELWSSLCEECIRCLLRRGNISWESLIGLLFWNIVILMMKTVATVWRQWFSETESYLRKYFNQDWSCSISPSLQVWWNIQNSFVPLLNHYKGCFCCIFKLLLLRRKLSLVYSLIGRKFQSSTRSVQCGEIMFYFVHSFLISSTRLIHSDKLLLTLYACIYVWDTMICKFQKDLYKQKNCCWPLKRSKGTALQPTDPW